MREVNIADLSAVDINWKMLTLARPKTKVDEEIFSKWDMRFFFLMKMKLSVFLLNNHQKVCRCRLLLKSVHIWNSVLYNFRLSNFQYFTADVSWGQLKSTEKLLKQIFIMQDTKNSVYYLIQFIEHPILRIPNILFAYFLSIFSK